MGKTIKTSLKNIKDGEIETFIDEKTQQCCGVPQLIQFQAKCLQNLLSLFRAGVRGAVGGGGKT